MRRARLIFAWYDLWIVESGGAIDAREATWLLAELDRLHQLEVAMADNERAGDRLGDAVASARAADPRGGR